MASQGMASDSHVASQGKASDSHVASQGMASDSHVASQGMASDRQVERGGGRRAGKLKLQLAFGLVVRFVNFIDSLVSI